MFQKIRKNKFFRKALVFASVFLILATTLVFPVLALAPSIDINGSSYDFSTGVYYFNEPDSSSTNSLVLMSFRFGDNEYYIFFEPFFDDYGFSLTDNAGDIYDILEEDYYHNDYDTSNYLVYDGYGSTYMLYSAFYSRSSFINSFNSQFSWAIDKNNQVNSLTQQNTTLNNQVNSLNNQIAAKDEEIAFKQQQIESANRQYQILSNQYNDLNASYNIMLSEYNTLSSNYYTLLDDYNSLETNNNALQSNYDTLQSNYNTLNNNYISLQSDYDNLQAENDELELEWSELYDKYLVAESEGYTRALNDMDAFRKGLFDIFNAPFEFVRNLTGAEIFGINIFGIFCFFLVFMLGLYLFYILRGLIF